MMTGDEVPSYGNAYLLGSSLISDRTRFLSMIGYCPQFDSIIEVLTGREMLILFARSLGHKTVFFSFSLVL
jgi:ABC-type multidrug transport system ATPase subunit